MGPAGRDERLVRPDVDGGPTRADEPAAAPIGEAGGLCHLPEAEDLAVEPAGLGFACFRVARCLGGAPVPACHRRTPVAVPVGRRRLRSGGWPCSPPRRRAPPHPPP